MQLEKMDKRTLILLCLQSGAYQRPDGLRELAKEELIGRLRAHMSGPVLLEEVRKLMLHAVVQLDPTKHTHHEGFWAGNFMLVTQVRDWGVRGFCKVPGGDAFYRAEWGTFSFIGDATWVPNTQGEEG